MLTDILRGVAAAADPVLIGFMMVGVLIGLVIGILPGIGGMAGIAMLLPFFYGMDPTYVIALLVGLFSVLPTGGSVTSILLNIPGQEANAATLLDGFPMTERGHPGRALGIALTASALGGVVGAILLASSMVAIRPIVMSFKTPASLILVLMGITFIGAVGSKSPLKGLIAGGVGIVLSFVGYFGVTGEPRYTFGVLYLWDGIGLLPMALGLFAIPEVITLMTTGSIITESTRDTSRSDLFEGCKDVFRRWQLFLRSSIIGTIVGLTPGLGGTPAGFIAYGSAKQTSKHPEEFGTGCVEGILAPESANNAKEGGALIPTLALGIPGSSLEAMLLMVFVIFGLEAGPFFLQKHLDLTFTIVVLLVTGSMVGAGILLLLARQMSRVAFVPGRVLAPLMLLLVILGAYFFNGKFMDIVATFIIGGLGYLMYRYDYSRPSLFLGFILGVKAERYFYVSLGAYGWLFFTEPTALSLIILTALFLSYKQIIRGIKAILR